MRDQQRAKLYRAERAVGVTPGRTFKTVPEVEAYVARLWKRAWFRRHFPAASRRQPPRVKDGRGRSNAGGCYSYITLPRWARVEWVILHELAHGLVGTGYGHGWQFAACYLKLVRYQLGKPAADALKASYRREHVRWRLKRRRPISDERRAALVARLASYRASRLQVAATQQQAGEGCPQPDGG